MPLSLWLLEYGIHYACFGGKTTKQTLLTWTFECCRMKAVGDIGCDAPLNWTNCPAVLHSVGLNPRSIATIISAKSSQMGCRPCLFQSFQKISGSNPLKTTLWWGTFYSVWKWNIMGKCTMSSEWMSIFISMEITSCVTFYLCLFKLEILKTRSVVDFSVILKCEVQICSVFTF